MIVLYSMSKIFFFTLNRRSQKGVIRENASVISFSDQTLDWLKQREKGVTLSYILEAAAAAARLGSIKP